MKTKTICGILLAAMLVLVALIPIGILKVHGTYGTFPTISGSEYSQHTRPTYNTRPTHATNPFETSEPSDPSEPSEPSEPTAPTEPSEPPVPTEPTDPTAPSEPTNPTDPTQPIEPTDPTEPSEPTEPTEPPEPEDPTMHVSDNMLTVLKELEGFRPYAYWDYKQWSIGYGSVCPSGMEKYYQENPISKEYAEELLMKELVFFEKKVNEFIQEKGLTLTQNQYDALVSFSYNCGAGWTSETTGNFHNAVISGNTGSFLVYGMMLWSTAGNEYILIPRRTVETNMYANGVYEAWKYPDRYRCVFMDAAGGTVNYRAHGFDAEDPTEILTIIKSAPVGPDESGARVTYVFDGWYTAREGGIKVEILDETIPTGTVLYAHWKTPAGTPVVVPRQDTGFKMTVTVTATDVNIRSGPQTYYALLAQAQKGDQLEIVEVARGGGMLWGRFGDSWICLTYTDYEAQLSQLLPLWGKVTADGVNVRTGAGTSNSLVEGVKKNKGDLVLVSEWKTDGAMMWGRIDEGWIALLYVTFEGVEVEDKTVLSIELNKVPAKFEYVQMVDQLDLSGGSILVNFADGSTQVVELTPEMVTGFDNSTVGTKVMTVTYGEQTTMLVVEIVKAKVSFVMDDGTLISEEAYLYGDTVKIPEDPTKPAANGGYYRFVGWDKEVTAVAGNTVYTAVFEFIKITGDCNSDGILNDQDVVYLLGHVLFPEVYPVDGWTDMNGDGNVNDQDVVYLLGHVLFPDVYPLAE